MAPGTTTPNDIVLKTKIYLDTNTRKHTANSTWKFKDSAWKKLREGEIGMWTLGCPGSGTCSVGGRDGFGVAFDRGVADPGTWSVGTWGVKAGSYFGYSNKRMAVSNANTNGVSFTGYDQVRTNSQNRFADYNFANGSLTYSFDNMGCGNLSAFGKYFHTWDEVTINGISVGPWSLGVSWAGGGENWEYGGPASNTFKKC
jgi:hypothetical protein